SWEIDGQRRDAGWHPTNDLLGSQSSWGSPRASVAASVACDHAPPAACSSAVECYPTSQLALAVAGANLIAAIFCCLGWPAVLVLVMSVVDAGCSRLWLLALGCLACFVFVVTQAQWESRLEYAGGAYIIGSARAPLWSPPPRSSYSDFQEAFSESEGFPPEPAATVVLALKWDWMLLDALLGLWAVTGLGSIFYLGNARHRVLRVAA